jgi:hypothetical protein
MTSHSSTTEAESLLALSEKVGRVAQSLAELALERDPSGSSDPDSDSDPERLREAVDRQIHARSQRSRFVPGAAFGEPVWDVLLHLLHAEAACRTVFVADACAATGLPEGVARRWLDSMVESGLVTLGKSADPPDQQVALADDVSVALRRYFREIVDQR